MKTIIKNTIILFAITLVAGLGLGFVYNVTLDARAAQEEKTKIEAYQSVMAGMDSFETVVLDSKKIQTYIEEKVQKVESEHNISVIKPFSATIDEVVLAKDAKGAELGYIVTVTDNEAYSGSLQMAVGISKDKTVQGISFLTLSETPGLGMKAGEDSFKSQFKMKKTDYFQYQKSGAKADGEVNAISSATITSNAVVHGVNGAIYCVEYLMGGGE